MISPTRKGGFRKKTTGQNLSFFMAEKEGFEPSIPFWGIHDFQSCALGQLRDFSVNCRLKSGLENPIVGSEVLCSEPARLSYTMCHKMSSIFSEFFIYFFEVNRQGKCNRLRMIVAFTLTQKRSSIGERFWAAGSPGGNRVAFSLATNLNAF